MYRKYLDEQRQEKPQNKLLSYLITTALKEKGKNLFWLSKQAGIPSQCMYKYAKGMNIPNMDTIDRMWQVLDLDYDTLDSILEDWNEKI